jgi:hypothetical protein
MRHVLFLPYLATLLVLLGCGGGRGGGGGGSARDAGPDGGSGDRDGGGPGDDGGSPGDDAGTCTPITTGARTAVGCDWVRVGILQETAGAPRVEIRGRISGASGECAVLETIEFTNGTAPVAVIDAAGTRVTLDDQNAAWGVYDAAADLVAPCSGDDGRLEPFGVIVRGATETGPFEARCGSGVELGSGWPPRVFRTCHTGLSRMPTEGNSLVMPAGMFTTTMGYFAIPHGAGEAVTTVDGDVRVTPYTWMAAPAMPRDTTGWMGSSSETPFLGETASQVSFYASEDLLGTEVCPVACDPIMEPSCPTPPVWLGRFTGTTERGAFRTEVLFTICSRPRPPTMP